MQRHFTEQYNGQDVDTKCCSNLRYCTSITVLIPVLQVLYQHYEYSTSITVLVPSLWVLCQHYSSCTSITVLVPVTPSRKKRKWLKTCWTRQYLGQAVHQSHPRYETITVTTVIQCPNCKEWRRYSAASIVTRLQVGKSRVRFNDPVHQNNNSSSPQRIWLPTTNHDHTKITTNSHQKCKSLQTKRYVETYHNLH